MSSTFSQKMSKIIADELGVSYQKTYISFVKALEQVHPQLAQEQPVEDSSANTPEHAPDWLLTIEQMHRQSRILKELFASRELSPKTQEKIVITLDQLYVLATDLEDEIAGSCDKASAQYMDTAVTLAARGQFHGWDAWMPPDHEELWASLVRTGYAINAHSDETGFHEISESCDDSRFGSCKPAWMLNKRGIKTFLIDGEEPNTAFIELEKYAGWTNIETFN